MFELVGNMLYISKVDSTIKNMRGWQKYGKKPITAVFGGAGRLEELMQGIRIMKSLKLTPEQAAMVLIMVDNTNLTIKDCIIAHIKAASDLTGINCDNDIGLVQGATFVRRR